MEQQSPPPVNSPELPADSLPSTDPDGIGSASRSCLVILALGVAIVLIVCVSTVVRLIWG